MKQPWQRRLDKGHLLSLFLAAITMHLRLEIYKRDFNVQGCGICHIRHQQRSTVGLPSLNSNGEFNPYSRHVNALGLSCYGNSGV